MEYRKGSNQLSRRHSLNPAARPFTEHNSGAVYPPWMNYNGVHQAPPPEVVQLPPNYSSFQSYPSMREQQQPPLLPLPVAPPVNHRAGITRGASLPPNAVAFGGGNRKAPTKTSSFRSKKSTNKGANVEIPAQRKVVSHEVSLPEPGMFAGISPPPASSLPMPSFSMKPKRSCTTQAGGDATGAADNHSRFLRFQ